MTAPVFPMTMDAGYQLAAEALLVGAVLGAALTFLHMLIRPRP